MKEHHSIILIKKTKLLSQKFLQMKSLIFSLLLVLSVSSNHLNGQALKVYNDLFSISKNQNFAASRNSAVHFLDLNKKSVNDLFKNGNKAVSLSLPFTSEKTIQVDLIEANIFADNFTVVNSKEDIINLPLGRHFNEHSFVAFSIFEDQIFGIMSDASGNYNVGKIKGAETYAFYNDRETAFDQHYVCSVKDKPLEHDISGEQPIEERNAKTVNLYVELDHDIIIAAGSVNNAVSYATAMYNQVLAMYAKDGITFKVSKIKAWDTASPYSYDPNSEDKTGDYLVSFQKNSGAFEGNVAQLITLQDIGGGVATGFNALCASEPDSSKCIAGVDGTFENIPTFSWDVQVCTHEIGHLLGSRHTHACVWNGNNTAIDGCADYIEGQCNLPGYPAEGGTTMSYCHQQSVGINMSLGFGPQPKNYILNRINNAACLGGGSGTLTVNPTFITIPPSGDCQNIAVTSSAPWQAGFDTDYPPFFLTSAAPLSGTASATIKLCASKNTLPVPLYTRLFIYDGTTEIPVIIRQDSVHEPTAVFYPVNEKITPFTKETFSLDILTNTDWKLIQKEYDQKWVTIKSAKSGTKNAEFTVQVEKNTTPLNRYSRITMVYNNGLDTTYFTISQPSENSGYLNVPSEFTAFKDENTYGFQVLSDLDWEIINDNPWIKDIAPLKGKKNQIVTLTVTDNDQGVERFGTLTFIAKTIGNDSIVKTVNINQLKERSGNSNIKDKVYPNPASDFINIELSTVKEEQIDAKIYDASGRIVKVLEQGKKIFGAFNHRYQINDLQPGFYTITIKHGDSVIKEKLVIIK